MDKHIDDTRRMLTHPPALAPAIREESAGQSAGTRR